LLPLSLPLPLPFAFAFAFVAFVFAFCLLVVILPRSGRICFCNCLLSRSPWLIAGKQLLANLLDLFPQNASPCGLFGPLTTGVS
jgi:hypothetical protein